MRVNLTIELDDDARRKLRAHFGQSGLATRDEVRGWVEALINSTIEGFNEPTGRRRRQDERPPLASEPVQAEPSPGGMGIHRPALGAYRARREAAENAPAEARCQHCNRPKEEHGLIGFACPAPHRTTFTMAE